MEAWRAKLDMGEQKGIEINLDNGTKHLKILTPKDKTHMKNGLAAVEAKNFGTNCYIFGKGSYQ